jgi:hypothetical protein
MMEDIWPTDKDIYKDEMPFSMPWTCIGTQLCTLLD